MTKTHWLAATCAIALLSGGSALAQTQTKPMDPGAATPPAAGTMDKTPARQADKDTMDKTPVKQADKDAMDKTPVKQADKDAMDKMPARQADKDTMDKSPEHAAAKPMHMARSARTDTSQDAAVDQLNDRSLQAAQQGKPFSVDNSGTPTGKKM